MNTFIPRTYGMKGKTIKDALNKKLTSWFDTLPPDLKRLVERHVVVTGGCIASMLTGEKVSDYDVYIDDRKVLYELAGHYCTVFDSDHRYEAEVRIYDPNDRHRKEVSINDPTAVIGIWVQSAGAVKEPEDNAPETEKPLYRPIFMSQNAITLSGKIQIVLRFCGPPDEIHENFDYEHAKCSYWTANDELRLPQSSLECLLSRTLRYTGSLYPVCSLFRMRKFIKRGWRISAGEITKMAMQISELDLHDINVLREQLTGVDALYFHDLLTKVHAAEKTGASIDSAMIINLIEEIDEGAATPDEEGTNDD